MSTWWRVTRCACLASSEAVLRCVGWWRGVGSVEWGAGEVNNDAAVPCMGGGGACKRRRGVGQSQPGQLESRLQPNWQLAAPSLQRTLLPLEALQLLPEAPNLALHPVRHGGWDGRERKQVVIQPPRLLL